MTGAITDNIYIFNITEEILPQFIQGILASPNTARVPFAYRATISGLIPNATYRYFNQVVISTDLPTANGAGNCIFPNAQGTFIRTSNPDFTPGNYSEFTTDATGSYTGWFITEPTGNARFVVPKTVYMRIMLNDGAGGTDVVTRLTIPTAVTVKNFGSTITEATGIRGYSFATPSNFVALYDNESGVGRPIACTFIENDGCPNTNENNYVAFYADSVNGFDGRWGTLIPNDLPNGVRRIEQRSFATGNIENFAIDSDGIWLSGANTVNPNSGTMPVVITSKDAPMGSVVNTYLFSRGWNMVSLPLVVNDPRRVTLFPTAISNAFLFIPGTGYVLKDTIHRGIGYWLKFHENQTIPIEGIPVYSDSINLVTGWNLIGTVADTVSITSILTDPENIITSNFYGYENGYIPVTILYPAKAYWVKVNQNGKLYLNPSKK